MLEIKNIPLGFGENESVAGCKEGASRAETILERTYSERSSNAEDTIYVISEGPLGSCLLTLGLKK